MLREALLDPSIGSITTVISASGGPVTPDSSLTINRARPPSTFIAATSATTSIAYWPGIEVRARRSGPEIGCTALVIATHTSPNISISASGSIAVESGRPGEADPTAAGQAATMSTRVV